MSSISVMPAAYTRIEINPEKRNPTSARLRRAVEALLRSHQAIRLVGPSPAVDHMAFRAGLDVDDYCQFDVSVGGRRVNLVCVPSKSWNDTELIDCFLDLRRDVAAADVELLFVPEAFFRDAHPSQCRWIAGAGSTISSSDRVNVLLTLLDQGCATVGELASAIRNSNPVSAILHLAAVGALEVDLSAPIVMSTRVCLPTLGHF